VVSVSRPAVRVLCLDARQRLLLLRWRDPADGSYVWSGHHMPTRRWNRQREADFRHPMRPEHGQAGAVTHRHEERQAVLHLHSGLLDQASVEGAGGAVAQAGQPGAGAAR
jgi:hypothetical protein